MPTVLAVADAVNAREVVVAIVGGTMLTLALTRPRLAWMEQLTKNSDPARLWAERALTGFLLVMGGYAAVTLLVALHKQLGAEADALLDGAGIFLFIYAWLVHFEPFVREWRLRGGAGAAILYSGFVFAAVIVGGLLTEVALRRSFSWVEPRLALAAALTVAVTWGLYRRVPAKA
ncbi:MAG TPA: hypothetical protein VGX72_10545 [Solirubrobacteraceae bacterium]|nr:hypothetical protein [Solirubrobacteraceae bacterium]